MKGPLRVPIEKVALGERALDDEASNYVARVRRLTVGDKITVFDPEAALEADAEIIAINKRAVSLRIAAPTPATIRATRSITLIQAVGKGDKMDAIARDATELGATCLVPVIAERSVRQPEASRADRWRRIVVEAARQSGRGDVPRVEAITDLASALERYRAENGLGICFVPDADHTFAAALADLAPSQPVTFIIGPEGGLSPNEIEIATRAGYVKTTLGSLVLRTETVCAAALGALLARS
jgi:16S rRNA (uracil1498-N3)-methyltransferase